MNWPDVNRARLALFGPNGWILRALAVSARAGDELDSELSDVEDRLHAAEQIAAAAVRERDLLRLELKRKSRKRRPPEEGLAVPAISPRGPLPLQGGAEAPLDYSD